MSVSAQEWKKQLKNQGYETTNISARHIKKLLRSRTGKMIIRHGRIQLLRRDNGLDEKKIETKNDKFKILYVGRICIAKGIPYLLEAYKKIANSYSELLLIGPIHPDMLGIMKKYENFYTHISNVPHNVLWQFYDDSSVFVIPTLSDGSSLVVDKALSSGIPAITTNNNGNQPEDGVTGYVVPVRDSESLAECLSKLQKDRDLLNYIKENCIKKSGTVQDWQAYQADIISVYEKLVCPSKVKG